MMYMKNHEKPTIKLRVQLELAYEIIYKSVIVIFIGLAFLFASNMLILNGYSLAFGTIAILMFYFKIESHIKIHNNYFEYTVFKYIKVFKIDMNQVNEFIFYKNKRIVEIKLNNSNVAVIHLKLNQKEKLLNHILNFYPDIPCILNT